MRTEHTTASRLAAGALATLALLQLWWVVASDDRSVVTVLTPVGVLTVLAALKMLRDNCFESRLAAVVLSTLQVVAVLLGATVGLPGHDRQAVDVHVAASLVAAVCVIGLVAADHHERARRDGQRPTGSYAS